ncbi:hypothetical protein [Microcystis sp. M_QC_C_20170808_M3Col]|uniref:hypothetical protein n=1 Tax=Microcystis sp. M_QC_C_20170808_M3Col TaxID=2486216 RepID=UPI0011954E88|nr:hypothetical protein [Microcystis sp. M_QC_C_20170808_M3Col]TRT62635.1 MAG: hypothetical protein EWV84_22025 [Microcystis sp. M_QC_C_20170808_M3Col]
MWRFLSIVFDLERTNQLNLLPDKDLVDLCPHIESYQVTKNHKFFIRIRFSLSFLSSRSLE